MKKKLLSFLLILPLIVTLGQNSVHAEGKEELLRGAPCPDCGNMTVNIVPGYTTEWKDYEGIPCIHGYKYGYDMGQLRYVYSAYKKCSHCGWKSEQTKKQEGRLICHGYN